jgi:hypothetical protein
MIQIEYKLCDGDHLIFDMGEVGYFDDDLDAKTLTSV